MTSEITVVEIRPLYSGHGWLIIDSAGEKYHTKSALQASLAERAKIKGLRLSAQHFAGWYYRDLVKLALADDTSTKETRS